MCQHVSVDMVDEADLQESASMKVMSGRSTRFKLITEFVECYKTTIYKNEERMTKNHTTVEKLQDVAFQ